MNAESLLDRVDRFASARILVVGDIYLDENVYGVMTGISLEAPVPIFEVQERRHNPGAAGNAACNAATLGAQVWMAGYVGEDMNARIVLEEFQKRGVHTECIVRHPTAATNTYGKLRAGTFNAPSQEILRTDTPSPQLIAGEVESAIIEQIKAMAPKVDAIMVVDQVSSVVTEAVLAAVVEAARAHNLITVGDSRQRAGLFKDFEVIVPNDREACLGAGIEPDSPGALDAAGKALTTIARNALITRGPDGIRVFSKDGAVTDVRIDSVQAVDVTGAGDTVTACVACALCAGASLTDAAVLGNKAAGIAVQQQGVVTVSNEELKAALSGTRNEGLAAVKVKERDELAVILSELRAQGKRIVWTNGCFDLLHAGHLTYLHRTAQLGDVLVIGLNSDASVQKVKGPKRPIINEHDRALILAELECVSFLTFFGEPTVVPLLETLKPDIYAKGGDYTLDTINQEERQVVEGYGGRIELIAGVEGQSTTALIARIIETAGEEY